MKSAPKTKAVTAKPPKKTAKTAAKRPPPKKTVAKKTVAKKAVAKKAVAKKAPTEKTAPAKKHGPRGDYGAPIDGFFAKQPADLRAILEVLRTLVEQAAPTAESSIKWGMPFYSLDGTMMCALGAHKSHVNLILAGAPDAYVDPEGRLSGEGGSGRHLKIRSIDELPRANVRKWLRTAAELAGA